MIAPRTRGRVYLQSFMDALITFSTFWAVLFVFILLRPGESLGQLEGLGAALFYSIVALAAVLVQGLRTIYSEPQWWAPTWRASHRLSLNQVIWVTLAICVALAAIGDITTSRAFLTSCLVLLYFSLLIANRFLPGKIIETVYEGRRERTVFLGNMEAAQAVAGWREYQERMGTEFIDYIPDFSIADMANLERLMRERNVTQLVLMEIPELKFNLKFVVKACERVGARALLFNEFQQLLRHKFEVIDEADLQFVGLRAEPLERAHNRFLKRLADIVLSVIFIVTCGWIFILAAILLKLSFKEAVFVREPRIGFNGEEFKILKFRTKSVNGGSDAFGRWLCRWEIAEWPQVFNVLKGEMSMVGPRAHWPEQKEAFERGMRSYYVRSEVRPGITGLAQVRGFRGVPHSEEEIALRTAADVEYVHNWSLWLDLVILWKTLGQNRKRAARQARDGSHV